MKKVLGYIGLVLLLVYTGFWVYQYNVGTIHSHLIETAMILVPVVAIVILLILKKKEKIKGYGFGFGVIIFLILFVIMNFFSLAFFLVDEFTSKVTDPKRYNYIYSISEYKNYTYQFPKELSESMINDSRTKFYYAPKFLQGSFRLELLLPLSSEEVSEYIAKYKESIKEVIGDEGYTSSDLYEKYGIMIAHHGYELEDYINNSTIYLLESETSIPTWNHGRVAYMATNEEYGGILLVTEIW